MTMRLHADRIDATIGTTPFGDLIKELVNILFFEIDCFCASGCRQCQAFGNKVDRDNVPGAQHLRAANAELSYRAATPNSDRVSILDLREFRALKSGWENVRQKEYLLVSQTFRHFSGAYVGKGDPDIF